MIRRQLITSGTYAAHVLILDLYFTKNPFFPVKSKGSLYILTFLQILMMRSFNFALGILICQGRLSCVISSVNCMASGGDLRL